MSRTSAVSPARLLHLVGLVPDAARRFDVGPDVARRQYGVGAAMLDELLAGGLPCRPGTDGRPLLDAFDLHNVALQLRLPSVPLLAMRSLAAALRDVSRPGGPAWRLSFLPTCPAPGHEPPCRYRLLLPAGWTDAVSAGGEPAAHLEVRPGQESPLIDGELRPVLDELAALQFFMVPPAVDTPELTSSTGLATCRTASEILVRRAVALGFAARRRFGLMVGRTHAIAHVWAELGVGGKWVAADPLMLSALARWGGLDAAVWPAHRSPAPVLVGLPQRPPYLLHDGAAAALAIRSEPVD